MAKHETLVRGTLGLLCRERPNIDTAPGSPVWTAVSRLLRMSPVEIEEFVSSGGLDALDSLLFEDLSPAKLGKFKDRVPLKLNLRSP